MNPLFEVRLANLGAVMLRVARMLEDAQIEYEIIGGMAIIIHIEPVNPELTTLTRDVDMLVHRGDLVRIAEVASIHGFRYRHARGLDMLMYGETDNPREAVHLMFAGERVKPDQPVPNPPIDPERRDFLGQEVNVASVEAMVMMKLNANRSKDEVHLQSLDDAGLLDPAFVRMMPGMLRDRLVYILGRK